MRHCVKKLTVIAIAMLLLLSMSAFAQSNSADLKTVASAKADAQPPKGVPAAPQHTMTKSSQNWMTHRFEISFQGGGVIGGSMGEPNLGACTTAVTNGCDPNQFLNHDISIADGGVGVLPGLLGGLRTYQRFGALRPGNGGLWGIRAGFNISPHWQLEFVWNHATTNNTFTNQEVGDDAVAHFNGRGYPGDQTRTAFFVDGKQGRPQGDQNMYLVNINRMFNQGRRVQPYIGAGLGAETWYANPQFDLITDTQPRPEGPRVNSGAQFFKGTTSATGFAFDVQAGAKMYLTERFGVRADVAQVFSFPDFRNRFSTFDISDIRQNGAASFVPMTGSYGQSGRFSQTLFTGGAFWAFGGGWTNPDKGSMGTFDKGNEWDRWEISWNFGGVHGRRNDSTAEHCSPSVVKGCVFEGGEEFNHSFVAGGIYPNRIIPTMPTFLTTGTLNPGDGWATGLRVSYGLNPNWELAFTWNISGTGVNLSNKNLLDQSVADFQSGEVNDAADRNINYVQGRDGHARGNQSTYLFNLNRNFRFSGRFVPYVGAGFGWEAWNGFPTVDVRTSVPGSSVPNDADFVRHTRNTAGFAVDLAGGGKFYLSHHFGVRFDVMDVHSWQNFKTDFASIDTSGLYGTPGAVTRVAGTLRDEGHFSQLVTTAGMFYSFGNGGTWTSSDPLKPGSGPNAGKWELSFQVGGIVGGNIGEPDPGRCRSLAFGGGEHGDGCDVNQPLTIAEDKGIYPGPIGGLRNLQRFGTYSPGSGGLFGTRLGYNLNPHWQLEFVWNHTQAQMILQDWQMIDPAVASYRSGRYNDTNDARTAVYQGGQDGRPKGNQNMWLVNLNRNFNVSGRIVPYVGFGGGMESWFGGPKMNILAQNPDNLNTAVVTKIVDGKNLFAMDVQAGAKIYLQNNFGFRFDLTNVSSFGDINSNFTTVDVGGVIVPAGGLVPVSGKLSQSAHFNQTLFTAGMFWSIGGRMDTHGADKFTGDRDSMNDRWEISFNLGGAHGGSWGGAGTSCSDLITNGCLLGQYFGHRTNTPTLTDTFGVFPGRIKTLLPGFLAQGGIEPGDGWTTGLQLGYNLTPHWQISFLWNSMGLGNRFDNEDLLRLSQNAFYTGCNCADGIEGARDLHFVGGANGRPRGNQQQFLVNLNRNFRVSNRLVPYVGAGGGAMVWNNNPRLDMFTHTAAGDLNGCCSNDNNSDTNFIKKFPSKTGFALDIAAGFKYYVSRHWGLRADMLNVTSFQEFSGQSLSIDTSGLYGTPGALFPISGKIKQDTKFNVTSGTGGVFFTF